MATALIVYGSTTGNTEYVAEVVERVLSAAGITVKMLGASNAEADGLCNDHDLILFGCSTWGDEEVELQEDFIPLFEEFDSINAKGKKVGVFGCGDSSYTWFCGAVDHIELKLNQMGADVVVESLKIDGDPHTVKKNIEDWAGQVVKSV